MINRKILNLHHPHHTAFIDCVNAFIECVLEIRITAMLS